MSVLKAIFTLDRNSTMFIIQLFSQYNPNPSSMMLCFVAL